jgi:signal transduction histidine kinase
MAPTLDRRGSDDRRSPLLATPEAGRERGGTEIPAHRAGGRYQVRGTGLRAALARVNIAVTSILVLAFLAPLALVVTRFADDHAMADAEQQADVVIAALAATTNPDAVRQAIVKAMGDRASRIGVHGLASGFIGTRHATDENIAQAAERAMVVGVEGGQAYLEPVTLGQSRTAVVEVFIPDTELARGVDEAWWPLAGVAAFLMLVSVLAGDRLAARVVRSARGLAAAARTLGGGDLTVRVPPQGPRELAEAAHAFNVMADRVATMRAAERELIADLSHRLRTPLTALRLEADRVRGSERFSQAIEAMEREVDNLIHTARRPAEAREPEPAQCDAGEVVRERMAFWAAVADDQSRQFRVVGTDRQAPVPISASELAAALDALLGNVFRYTPQGTPFEVAVTRRDGYVAVRIDDAGPGIDRPLHAVRRGTSGRGSTGLGLDIVRRAAMAGRGTVDIDRSTLGGTSVVVLLADAVPAAPSGRQMWGFVGRLSREPNERRWGRRARAERDGAARP